MVYIDSQKWLVLAIVNFLSNKMVYISFPSAPRFLQWFFRGIDAVFSSWDLAIAGELAYRKINRIELG